MPDPPDPSAEEERWRTAYRRDGFVHLAGVLDPADLPALAAELDRAPERDPGDNPLSLGTMRFASNLFHGSSELRRFLVSDPVVRIVTALAGPDTWVRWDQAVWKRPGAPVFPLHQDNGYTGLAAEHLQLWVALTDMDEANGGLQVVPGGHRSLLPHRWVGNHVVTDAPVPPVVLEVVAGDVVAFSSFLPHATTANRTDATRLAYVAEFLPLSEPDAGVRPPFLIATRDGRAVGVMADELTGPDLL